MFGNFSTYVRKHVIGTSQNSLYLVLLCYTYISVLLEQRRISSSRTNGFNLFQNLFRSCPMFRTFCPFWTKKFIYMLAVANILMDEEHRQLPKK